jgi:hypothetical protein
MTIKSTRKTNTLSLEQYLRTCPVNEKGEHFDVYNFDDVNEAYEFGQKLRANAIKEEGVIFADQMERFAVDISYMTVRIKLLVGELARC